MCLTVKYSLHDCPEIPEAERLSGGRGSEWWRGGGVVRGAEGAEGRDYLQDHGEIYSV